MKGIVKIVHHDGSEWFMPATVVASNKASAVAKKTNTDAIYVLAKEVMPEFEKNPEKIIDWAKNHMKPEEISLIRRAPPRDSDKADILKNGAWGLE